jgi:DNA-binding PadR family transcriptional regulator
MRWERWSDAPGWMGFRPWGRSSRFFETGEVRWALLSLLEGSPKHGYQLIKDLEARSGGVYRASAGAVYPTLQQLEDEGLLVSESRDGKRVYSLTEGGRAELEKNAEQVRRIWSRAKSWGVWAPFCGPEGSMIATMGAGVLKAALSASKRSGGDPERISKIQKILDQARQELDALGV